MYNEFFWEFLFENLLNSTDKSGLYPDMVRIVYNKTGTLVMVLVSMQMVVISGQSCVGHGYCFKMYD